jgi:hypothetical protein
MARSRKFDYQNLVEKELGAAPDGISLDELLQRCALEVDRSTLFRHLARLIEIGRVERIGKARASRYRLRDPAQTHTPAVAPPDQFLAPAPSTQTAQQAPLPEPLHLAASAAPHLPQSGRTEPYQTPPAAPDYGTAVRKAVRTVVRDWKRRNDVNLRIYLSLLVKREQIEAAAVAVEVALAGLHEGNLNEYGLTPAEFDRFIASEHGQTAGG